MLTRDGLTTWEVADRFHEEVEDLGGEAFACERDDARLFARALVPGDGQVAPGDRFEAGVALRLVEGALLVAPYLRRVICRNGQVLMRATEVHELTEIEERTRDEVLEHVASSVARCSAPSVFQGSLTDFRRLAVDRRIDLAVTMFDSYTHGRLRSRRAFAAGFLDALDLQTAAMPSKELRAFRAAVETRFRTMHEERQWLRETGLAPAEPLSDRAAFLRRRRELEVLAGLRDELIAAYLREGSTTAYAVLNALTAVARDLTDPAARWTLEELAGRYAWLIAAAPEGWRGLTFDERVAVRDLAAERSRAEERAARRDRERFGAGALTAGAFELDSVP